MEMMRAAPAPEASASAATGPMTPAEIAASATPSVVSIRSTDSLGSGFVVREDGWIATNFHVIADADELTVTESNGRTSPVAQLIAIDPTHDLALLKIERTGLKPLVLAESEAVRSGDAVVAIGHPLGFEDTVSNGLVSAIRHVSEELTVLQISAPIAPGSSGGPLIDDRGRVIGVATAIFRGGQNLGFGVPSEYLTSLVAHPEPIAWAEFVAAREHATAALPRPTRNVPHHELSLLDGCGEGDLRLLGEMIADAIKVGAPLYNEGNFAACYHVYEGASSDAERRLGSGCKGPMRALADGRKKASALKDPSGQAWAMRDAFDGLIDVINRKLDPH